MRIHKMVYTSITLAMLSTPSFSHDPTDTTLPGHAHFLLAADERNNVNISMQGAKLVIQSNGIPEHHTGSFPNRNNPNAIRSQPHRYEVPINPVLSGRTTPIMPSPFGVALNGIPFDPGTAEAWKNDPSSGWNIDAFAPTENLGLDMNNAHVQPTGAYHYHGIPWGMVGHFERDEDFMMVGYAADGFEIYMPITQNGGYKSSYRLKSGGRPGGERGPGGSYDGTYVQDYEYVQNAGILDECNGTMIDGTYVYFLTEEYPFVPRCWKGTPDPSFLRRAGQEGQRGQRGPRHGPQHDSQHDSGVHTMQEGERHHPPPPPGAPFPPPRR